MANKFNEYFTNIGLGPTLANKNSCVNGNSSCIYQTIFLRLMFIMPTEEHEIKPIVGDLSSSPGYDDISPKIVKATIDLILPVL